MWPPKDAGWHYATALLLAKVPSVHAPLRTRATGTMLHRPIMTSSTSRNYSVSKTKPNLNRPGKVCNEISYSPKKPFAKNKTLWKISSGGYTSSRGYYSFHSAWCTVPGYRRDRGALRLIPGWPTASRTRQPKVAIPTKEKTYPKLCPCSPRRVPILYARTQRSIEDSHYGKATQYDSCTPWVL
jgi:hypothetical protein